MFNLVDFPGRAVAVDAVDFVDRSVDSVDFNKIDRVEVDFVASVYEALDMHHLTCGIMLPSSFRQPHSLHSRPVLFHLFLHIPPHHSPCLHFRHLSLPQLFISESTTDVV